MKRIRVIIKHETHNEHMYFNVRRHQYAIHARKCEMMKRRVK